MQVRNECDVAKPIQQPKADRSLVNKISSLFKRVCDFKTCAECNDSSLRKAVKVSRTPIFDDDSFVRRGSSRDLCSLMHKP